ncbi:DEAD/DEAH box helicase [Brevibacillus ruminantium]|uniref:DEAD/DEAH box helicase n=1 Tax=Brevibacillus ruminantium TaxID=2950604 RepID=A0ABY4WJ50_9BACL|nr:DEAD/DEAH box helicase [Brevibacillus ruminantium]USG67161.1 DEAD/DEAH box helicase [Brevibacillus ruminantium]
MSVSLTLEKIRALCGRISYEKGKAFYQAGKVMLTTVDPASASYHGTVKGSGDRFQVAVHFHYNGDVEASCTCPSLDSFAAYCQHTAAVLFTLYELQQDGRIHDSKDSLPSQTGKGSALFSDSSDQPSGMTRKDVQLTDQLLTLFQGGEQSPESRIRPLFDTREALAVQFVLKPFSYGYRKQMFGLEMKVGPKRLYIVQRVREFLERYQQRAAFVFSRYFTYDPGLHRFCPEDHAVLTQLLHIYQNEKLFRESLYAAPAKNIGGERMLLIPPDSWEVLLPLLMAAPSVQLLQDDHSHDGLQLSEEPLPLRFSFDEAAGDDYQLEVDGLEQLIVMEAYGLVLYDGKLLRLGAEACQRLAAIKSMLDASGKHSIQIASRQMEPFLVQVIPGLKKLGSVQIAKSVSERILHTPLQARLYLDRVRDRLLAGLEFQYGDIVINPLEGTGQSRGSDRILMRDGEQERKILELMEQGRFTRTESGYFLDDEEAEYEFLYHHVPLLERLVKVYATSAVKTRLYRGPVIPKINVDVDGRTDWLEFRFDVDGIPEKEIRSLLQSLEEKRRYHRLANGALLPLENQAFDEITEILNGIAIHKSDARDAVFRLPLMHALHVVDTERRSHTLTLGKSLRRLLENLRNPDHLDFPVPESLAPVLREYQVYGFQWMKTMAHYRFGGILADDMGLGKTLQSIAFLVSMLADIREQGRPALVVSPASLMYNWRNELKKFAPAIRAVIADGEKAERRKALQQAGEADVVITSYPLLRRDLDLYTEHRFQTLILDEAQAFKNYTTQTAQAVKSLEADYRFALTGTPVENNLEELWSIFDAVFPALFTDRKSFQELSREHVAKRIRPFLLRRVKSDVLKELPDKIEMLQASELLPEQKKLYLAYLSKLQQETLKHLDDDTFEQNRIKILAGLTRLRQLCCHPALFVEDYSGSSAKFEQLLEIVAECRRAGKRPLIFSQFTEMLGLIARELGYQGVPFFYLDGNTPAAERVELCSRFNDGERDLFLLSLKAGGTGLNLTGADTVILYDLWWNPAVEEQAMDRAHRIGQKNVVQVIRLVSQGTVEEKMFELQQKKKNLIEEVIRPGQEAFSSLTEQDIREILMIG